MPKTTKAAKKSQHALDVDPRFARVAQAFARAPEVTYGKMFASMGLKVSGKIFAMFVKGRFVAKLPKERVDELVRSGTGAHFDPGHGRLMKEWIALEGTEELWLDLAKEARRSVSRAK
jgi:TfoX/Sxy family transcriptional regulator of competence genes